MLHDGLLDLLTYGHNRIQGRHRLLEYHSDAASADLPHVVAVLLVFQNVLSVLIELYPAAGHPAGVGQELDGTHHGHGLTGPGLSDKTYDLAFVDLDGDSVEYLQDPVLCAEASLNVVDIQQ